VGDTGYGAGAGCLGGMGCDGGRGSEAIVVPVDPFVHGDEACIVKFDGSGSICYKSTWGVLWEREFAYPSFRVLVFPQLLA